MNKKYVNDIILLIKKKNKNDFKEEFLKFPAFEQMETYMVLDIKKREFIKQNIEAKDLAEMYSHIDLELLKNIFKESSDLFNKTILENVSIDDAVNMIKALPSSLQSKYLGLLDKKIKVEVKELMEYDESTAGSLMMSSYIKLNPFMNVKEAMKELVNNAKFKEHINNLFVVDDFDKLIGVLSLKELIIADSKEVIKDIMNEKIVSTYVYEDQEDVANLMRDYDLLSIPVKDQESKLVGIITIDDIIDVIDEEANSDYSRFAAISSAEINIDTETIFKSVKKRIPWLLGLLLIGMVISTLISSYEHVLSEVLVLSFFMTPILDMAGNTGTQSLAVTVRGLTTSQFDTKKNVFKHLKRELFTGFTNGLIIGVTVFFVSYIFLLIRGDNSYGFENHMVSLVISLSMVIALTVSTIAGALIPLVMNKIKIDPTVASGPFITTINDVIGLWVYFQLAKFILLN